MAREEGPPLSKATVTVPGAEESRRMEFALKQALRLAFTGFHIKEK